MYYFLFSYSTAKIIWSMSAFERKVENLCWSIINYYYYTALLQNTNIYTVYVDSRVAGAQSFQLHNSKSDGTQASSQPVKHQT